MRVPPHTPFSYPPSAGVQHELMKGEQEEEQKEGGKQGVRLCRHLPPLQRGTFEKAGLATVLVDANDGSWRRSKRRSRRTTTTRKKTHRLTVDAVALVELR